MAMVDRRNAGPITYLQVSVSKMARCIELLSAEHWSTEINNRGDDAGHCGMASKPLP